MHGEARHAEASRDAVFAEHWIGGQPLPQTLGQHLGLFGSGLWHQHDKLIATVSGDDVRLPRLLLEKTSDPRQHQIAFEVTHGVIDLFKLVEIDEHHGKRASGARRTFPLCRQRLPKKSPRLNSRETIRDGLLLQFLKHKGVMQRSGQQIGECIQN